MLKKNAVIMGMPVTVAVVDQHVTNAHIESVFNYFRAIDTQFSTYKPDSEISRINANALKKENYSDEMKKILALCEETKELTHGYFNIEQNGMRDPSGLVKGYAIHNGAQILSDLGFKNYFVEIAGDIQTSGVNEKRTAWRVGIENPFNRREIVKVVQLSGQGIATSGNYIRGVHIYNPVEKREADELMSVTLIAQNVYEADRFATAAFAMGKRAMHFIGSRTDLAGYVIFKDKKATFTSGFAKYLIS